ncbi:hypothetical protein MJO28_009750 [Puccinia striiformis f. sp. tritici]|uniref:Uncharacterized protein n=2 Tax=Puccinia striiformis f. sp. tritici TaxID=168172 RepID=A0ACC0EA05_9BASI|nr:hypothetical protein MJO28_009747 [Puccinia striiformis f. sp. tritici]KAI7947842.1 hypothetical protein MJO28_009750 [Puccinia striiformis f. sp. tritici]
MTIEFISVDSLIYLLFLNSLRITVSFFTLATGLAVCALGIKSNQQLVNDRNRVSETASGTQLDSKALLNLTRTSLVMSASLIVNTLFLIVFLARRWHHPNPVKKDSILQKIRAITKLVMEGQFFIVCAIFSFLVTLLSNADTKFEPTPRNLHDFRTSLGIPGRYIENHYVRALVGTAWVFTFGYLLGCVAVLGIEPVRNLPVAHANLFILEGWILVRHKRFRKIILIEN